MLSGYIGRVDGSGLADATINFTGDGNLLQSFALSASDMPTHISIFVEGITELRIDVEFPGWPVPIYAFELFLE